MDEATVPAALAQIAPRLLLINNLFRDQLDRYGEMDTIHRRWRAALARLPDADPRRAERRRPQRGRAGPAHAGAGRYLRRRGHPPRPDRAAPRRRRDQLPRLRPPPRVQRHPALAPGPLSLPAVRLRPPPARRGGDQRRPCTATDGLALEIRGPAGPFAVELGVPGFYNAYNALAATAAALALGLSPTTIARRAARVPRRLRPHRARRGRATSELLLALVKNPVGFNEVLRMLFPPGAEALDGPKHLLIIINDLIADGRDVSWLWDVDFELLGAPGARGRVTTAGLRAADMANRLKYAGVPHHQHRRRPRPGRGAGRALAALPAGETLYVLPTYTAMLAFRELLHARLGRPVLGALKERTWTSAWPSSTPT